MASIRSFPRLFVLILFLGLPSTQALAQWSGPDGGAYSNPANWSGGVINDTFTGVLNPGGSNFGGSDGFDVVLDADRTTTGNFTINLTNITSNPWNAFMLRGNGGPTETLTFNGNLFVNILGNNQDDNRFVKFGEGNEINFNLGGATRYFMVTPGFRNRDGEELVLNGQISNGGIIKDGSGRLKLEGADDTFTGPLVVRNGRTEIGNNQATQSLFAGYHGRIRLYDSNRISDTAALTLNGGVLEMDHNNGSDDIGTLNISGGRNVIGWKNGSGNNNGTLRFADFNRTAKGTLLIGNKQEDNTSNIKLLGTDYKVLVTDSADVTSQLIGGSGGPGTTTQKILPWASFTSNVENGGRYPEMSRNVSGGMQPDTYVPNGGFLTYDATNGFRALNRNTEYFISDDFTDETGWTAGQNVRLVSNNNSGLDGTTPNGGTGSRAVVLTANRTINSLFVDRRADGFGGSQGDMYVEVGNGNTLTISSGGIVVNGGSTEFINGTVNFGNADAYISSLGRVKFNSKITGTGDLVVGAGYMHMDGDNSGWTGDLIVQGECAVENKQSISSANNIILAGNKMVQLKDENIGRFNVRNGDGQANAMHVGNLSGNGHIQFGNPDDSDKKKMMLGNVSTNLDSGPYANRSILAVGSGAHIQVGDNGAGLSGDYRVGIINIGEDRDGDSGEQAGKQDGTLLFEANSTLKIDLAGDSLYDQITFMGGTNSTWDVEFFANSTFEITLLDSYSPTAGKSWQIFSHVFNSDTNGWGTFAEGADIYGDNLMTFAGPAGYTWDLNNSGVLTLVAVVPEPSAGLLFGLGGLLVLLRRRSPVRRA